MIEKIKIKGHLEVIVRDAKTGRILQRNSGENLICVGMQNAIGQALEGNVDRHIIKVGIGKGTNPPTFNDTSLTDPVYINTLTVSYAAGTVTVSCTVGSDVGNGMNISEFGLFGKGAADDVLLARKVYPPIAKTESLVFDLTWRIQILTG